MTNRHIFKYAGKNDADKNVFIIFCKNTKGEFSTEIWRLEKFPKNQCPCCNEIIPKDRK